VLATAEEVRSSGVELLTALVVGYEVAMRAGCILHLLYDFYRGSGAWAPIGAAAGAARLLGCNAEQTRHTLGIAEFHAAMTPEMRSVNHPRAFAMVVEPLAGSHGAGSSPWHLRV
jgi:2-methylcitrate dehydratase PrpD